MVEKKCNVCEEDPDDFELLLYEVFKRYYEEKNVFEDYEVDNSEPMNISIRSKRRLNRLFRERVRGNYLPFPEADNAFERVRSYVVIRIRSITKRK